MRHSQAIAKARRLVKLEDDGQSHQWNWGRVVDEAEKGGALKPIMYFDQVHRKQMPKLKIMIESFAKEAGYRGDPQTVYQWYRTHLAWPKDKRKDMPHSSHQILKNVQSRFSLPSMSVPEAREYKGHHIEDRTHFANVGDDELARQISQATAQFCKAAEALRGSSSRRLNSKDHKTAVRNIEKMLTEGDLLMEHLSKRRADYRMSVA
jgi:hypothetical protein